MEPTAVPHPQEAEYDDLLGLWADLEAGLSTLLLRPRRVAEFPRKVRQYDRWIQDLLQHDMDTGLYLLVQLASNRSLGYSSAHALVCAVLCHVAAAELALPAHERESLVGAALTMNLAMTALQNQLAEQAGRPSAAQQVQIDTHGRVGSLLLRELGVDDTAWLQAVAAHHERTAPGPLQELAPAQRLVRVLQVVDRYGALLSPRRTRAACSVVETVRALLSRDDGAREPVGMALVRAIGLCPPGSFVRLDSGEVALVLRRGSRPSQPLLAIVLGRGGERLRVPRLRRAACGGPSIRSAITPDLLRDRVRLNHQALLRQALQADREHRL
ncbi:HD-GYP domain-containing protein [Pseudorhodoferax sp.]|uniref:HD-GYP domain-containing protein n=1 Tax=Pseudorhodoferax sp. TaxID=1993553 RepID=UPI0039E2BB17